MLAIKTSYADIFVFAVEIKVFKCLDNKGSKLWSWDLYSSDSIEVRISLRIDNSLSRVSMSEVFSGFAVSVIVATYNGKFSVLKKTFFKALLYLSFTP